MGTVGPLMAPFFLAYGLMRNAYIGTDALATVAMQGTKLAVFGGVQVLKPELIVAGFTLLPFMIGGQSSAGASLNASPSACSPCWSRACWWWPACIF